MRALLSSPPLHPEMRSMLAPQGASKWPTTWCFHMDTRAIKDSALSVSTFARQPARLRGFPQGVQGVQWPGNPNRRRKGMRGPWAESHNSTQFDREMRATLASGQ